MVVVTDLEGTLSAGETWRGLTDYLQQHGRAWAVRWMSLPYVPLRLLGRLGLRRSARDRLQFMLDLLKLMRGMVEAVWAAASQWLVERTACPERHRRVMAELEHAQRAGARVVICSGAFQPVVEAIAHKAGFEAIGTPIAWSDGRSTGDLAAPFTFGPRKPERLRAYLGEIPVDRAYGDTAGDIPMLEIAGEAVIVDHDAELRTVAVARGWRILTDAEARAAS